MRKITIYAFKVTDYTTVLFGQKSETADEVGEYYYVERGDGTKYKYHIDRIEWVEPYCTHVPYDTVLPAKDSKLSLVRLPKLKAGMCLVNASGELILCQDDKQGWEISSEEMWHTQFNLDEYGRNKAGLRKYDIEFVINTTLWDISSMREKLKNREYLLKSPYLIWRADTKILFKGTLRDGYVLDDVSHTAYRLETLETAVNVLNSKDNPESRSTKYKRKLLANPGNHIRHIVGFTDPPLDFAAINLKLVIEENSITIITTPV